MDPHLNYCCLNYWSILIMTSVRVVQTVLWKRLTMEMSHHSKIHFCGISAFFWEILKKWKRARYFRIFLSCFPIFIAEVLQLFEAFPHIFEAIPFFKKNIKNFIHWGRGGRLATTTSRPSHILLIFSSEPPRNPRPSFIICVEKFLIKSGHVRA